MRLLFLSVVVTIGLVANTVHSATLPPHAPLRILIVSDEVNPHGLPAAQLTQPGDISAALLTPGNGINISATPDAVLEIPTDNLSAATTALSVPITDPAAYDVFIYFAHRIPNGGSGLSMQTDFTAAVEAFLVAGGGLISFHHGAYFANGKEGILGIIGGTATGAVPWNTVDGQNVINVAPGHFVTTNEVEYPSSVAYSDVPRGVPASTYEYFNNTPDERYPNYQLNASAGDIDMLFGSNYNEGGTTHVLGFTHRRPEWAGVVVAYQPGEYQPNALDNLDGNNFQILANAIFYSAYGVLTGVGTPHEPGVVLGQNYPNPFNPSTTIHYTVTERGRVRMNVYDVRGEHIVTLLNEERSAGSHTVRWGGRDEKGASVGSGVYFVRLEQSGSVRSRKITLLK